MSDTNITSTGGDGHLYTLYYRHNIQPVQVGDQVLTGKGEPCTVTGGRAPQHAGSTGRVWVKFTDGGAEREFFPSVINCAWGYEP